jgi:hypothetical protein
MLKKLTTEQRENLELMYSSAINALMFCEELMKTDMAKQVYPIMVKLKWITGEVEMRVADPRAARSQDHLFYLQLASLATNMTDDEKQKLENFLIDLSNARVVKGYDSSAEPPAGVVL